jgi:hypothetical protein
MKMMRAFLKRRKTVLAVLSAALLLFSCETLIGRIIWASSITVTQGEYTDSIVVDWSTNHGTDSDDEDIEAYDYDVYISEFSSSGPWDGPFTVDDPPYVDYTDPGRVFYYYVRANLDDGSNPETNVEWGFAMNDTDLRIYSYDGGWVHSVTSSTAPFYDEIAWFSFEAQDGWSYRFRTYQDTVPVDTEIYLYRHPYIDAVRASSTPAGGFAVLDWTCTKTETYYLRIIDTGGTGNPFNLTAWHTDP